jgi:hypothetical protein
MGAVSLENSTPNAECALSRAKWDPKKEETVSTGRKIVRTDPAELKKRLSQYLLKDTDVVDNDISAFELDLDNDGRDRSVFVVSSLKRVAENYSGHGKPVPYFIYAGVLEQRAPLPALFYSERGDYTGATDAIADAAITGVVPLAPGTGEIALLTKTSAETRMIVRYRHGLAQRIDTTVSTCY